MPAPDENTPIGERLLYLRDSLTPPGRRPIGRPVIERRTHVKFGEGNGVSAEMLKMLEKGERNASAETIRKLAAVLGVDPTEFPEYRLALARRELDERAVGLKEALENLSRFEAGRRQSAQAPGRRASARTRATPKPTLEDRPARGNRKAT